MTLLHVLILSIVQGLAELLPVSSSAHVVVAAKLLGLDPSAPDMTLLLALLHTGTMFAVILYFWKRWQQTYFSSRAVFRQQAIRLAWATGWTALIGGPLVLVMEKCAAVFGWLTPDAGGKVPRAEIELLFGNLALVSGALAVVGVLILIAGLVARKAQPEHELGMRESAWIGAIQGLCLPFRGFSRSGATISVGLLMRVAKDRAEEFSFALAVILTPPVVARELWRVVQVHHEQGTTLAGADLLPGLLGMVGAFLAGLVALKWLSGWLEHGRWHLFGIYCLVAAAGVLALRLSGF